MSITTDTCKLPGCTKPVHPGHAFCGRTHAMTFQSQSSASPGTVGGGLTVPTCKLPGCTFPAYLDAASGKLLDCCRKSHYEALQTLLQHQQSAASQAPSTSTPQPVQTATSVQQPAPQGVQTTPQPVYGQPTPGPSGQSTVGNPQQLPVVQPSGVSLGWLLHGVQLLLTNPTTTSTTQPSPSMSTAPVQTCKLAGCCAPVHVDTSTGRVHDFCCKRHAQAFLVNPIPTATTTTTSTAPSVATCKLPGCSLPVFVDATAGITHLFCGRTHARLYAQTNPVPSTTAPSSTPTCKLPGCGQPVYVDPTTGVAHQFCRRSHGQQYALSNPSATPSSSSVRSSSGGSTLVSLSSGSAEYLSLTTQYQASWRNTSLSCATIVKIFEVNPDPAVVKAFKDYKKTKEHIPGFHKGGPGNTHRRWHGTSWASGCSFGVKSTTPCTSSSCGVCGISQKGFLMSKALSNTGGARFGPGLYFSSSSNKSTDPAYAKPSGGYQAVFANLVVLGRGHKMHTNGQSLTAPPSGYDSVLGETGQVLVYDGVVVYRNDACLPAYLLIVQ